MPRHPSAYLVLPCIQPRANLYVASSSTSSITTRNSPATTRTFSTNTSLPLLVAPRRPQAQLSTKTLGLLPPSLQTENSGPRSRASTQANSLSTSIPRTLHQDDRHLHRQLSFVQKHDTLSRYPDNLLASASSLIHRLSSLLSTTMITRLPFYGSWSSIVMQTCLSSHSPKFRSQSSLLLPFWSCTAPIYTIYYMINPSCNVKVHRLFESHVVRVSNMTCSELTCIF